MRSVFALIFFLLLVAAYWAGEAQLRAHMSVRGLRGGGVEALQLDDTLFKLGPAALPALRNGLQASDETVQIHCAKVLNSSALGDRDGEDFLLERLRKHPDPADPAGRMLEVYLISSWDLRNGPDEATRRRLREAEGGAGNVPEQVKILNEALQRYPNWADGYARRARINQMAGEAYEARRDALQALLRIPNHWEAMVTLGRVLASLDAAQNALTCFQRAVMVNPHLKNSLREDLNNAQKAWDSEQLRRRDDRRRAVPIV